MSFLLKSMQQFSYLNNKERENFFLSEDDDDDEFDFKYVPATQFKNVVKNVRRQKVKMDEERTWESFVKQQESLEGSDTMLNNFDPRAMTNIKEFPRENIGNVDRELKRLEEDAMPEINKIYKSIDGLKRPEGQPMVHTQKRAPVMKETGTGSSNILLTIPEEQNSHHTYRKMVHSKSKHVNNTRKSCSDHVMRRKDHSRKLLRAMDDSEYNSSPEPSPDRASEKEEEYFTRPDPIVVQKVLAIQKKVSSVLDEISFRLDRIPLPDGDRDLSRRLQRVAEFSVRFSRNYLYDLGRQITDMQHHIRAMAPDARPKPAARSLAFHLHAVGQKMVTAHQILLQALSAYCKHIPSSIVKGHPGKLKEILQIVKDLNDMCDKVNITSEHYGSGDADSQPLTKETHKKCSMILSKLQVKGLGSDDDSQLMSHTTQSTTVAGLPSSRSRRRGKQKRLSSRLSMYSIEANGPKAHPSRRPSTCFPKDRKYANVHSKFLNYNHSLIPKQPNPSLATVKSSSKEMVKNCPQRVRLPPREDDIRTMMDMLPPADSSIGSSVEAVPMNRYFSTNPENTKSETREFSTRHKIPSHRITTKDPRKVKSNKKVMDDQELKKQVTMITEEHLSSLVPVIADLMSVVTSKQNDFEIRPVSSASMETLLEFLQKYQSPQNETRKPTSPKSDRSKEIRSGSKNMQLICLPYDEEKDKESKCGDSPCEMNVEAVKKTTEIPNEETNLRLSTANNELKNGIQLAVPIATDFVIPEYHHRYQCFIRESPMYLSNTNNKPWDVVAWIVDKLVDELVAEISKELQMDNVIKKMFDLEFEEF